MKKALLVFALAGATILAGCGGSSDHTSQSSFNDGSGNQPFKPTTHLAHRSLVTNHYAGQLQVVDTYLNKLTVFSFAVGTEPTTMQLSPDATLTLVNNTGSGTISTFDNRKEAVKGTAHLSGATESFVTSKNNKFGFAAVYNYNNGNPPAVPGAIAPFNPTDGSTTPFIPFAHVRYLAMDTLEKHLLAFTDVPEVNPAVSHTAAYQAHWVDLTASDAGGLAVLSFLPLPVGPAGQPTLSRPVAAFFSADSTKAYILNCGVECGGDSTTIGGTSYPAWVTEVDVTTPSAAKIVNQWGVPGAQAGMIDQTANKLYVVGSSCTGSACSSTAAYPAPPDDVQDGNFTTIDLAAGTTKSLQIGYGSQRIIRNIKGTFWVGAKNCGGGSCITLVNPAGTGVQPTLPTPKGDATGITLNTNSGDIYTIEGQELQLYHADTTPVISDYNTDVKGQAYDVLFIN